MPMFLNISYSHIPSTFTVNEQFATFPDASVTVTTTTVSPNGNSSPGPRGEYVTFGIGSALSVTIGDGRVTLVVCDVMEAGHVTFGGLTSEENVYV